MSRDFPNLQTVFRIFALLYSFFAFFRTGLFNIVGKRKGREGENRFLFAKKTVLPLALPLSQKKERMEKGFCGLPK